MRSMHPKSTMTKSTKIWCLASKEAGAGFPVYGTIPVAVAFLYLVEVAFG